MKRLLVLRHAKSSWDDDSLADFERPLNDRGLAAAPLMGMHIKARGLMPDMVLSSPAVRASETARLVSDSAKIKSGTQFDERIYEASPATLLRVLSEIGDDAASVLIVGHNPGMEGLVQTLSGRFEAMPTAALAVLDLDIAAWKDIAPRCGKLIDVFRPKELRSKSTDTGNWSL